jgi:hypothetical protein
MVTQRPFLVIGVSVLVLCLFASYACVPRAADAAAPVAAVALPGTGAMGSDVVVLCPRCGVSWSNDMTNTLYVPNQPLNFTIETAATSVHITFETRLPADAGLGLPDADVGRPANLPRIPNLITDGGFGTSGQYDTRKTDHDFFVDDLLRNTTYQYAIYVDDMQHPVLTGTFHTDGAPR